MERGERFFKLSDVEKLSVAMCEYAAMSQKVGEMKSFPMELVMIAAVLKDQEMPQDTINMCLAARCGLPMQKVDGKSTYYRWTDDEPRVEQ